VGETNIFISKYRFGRVIMNVAAWWSTLTHFMITWGPNNLVGVFVGAFLTLVGISFRKIGYWIFSFVRWSSSIAHESRKDYRFKNAYLTWIINQHRYLGLLPAHTLTTRWGDIRRIVDLEKIYVALRVEVQKGDLGVSEATSNDNILSWQKHSWLDHITMHYLIYSLFISFIMIVIQIIISKLYEQTIYILPMTVALIIFLYVMYLRRKSLLQEKEHDKPGNLGFIIDKYRCVIIRGDPGSGKTTLLRYLAVTCARALRNNRKQGDSLDLVKKRLLWNTRPFPILVTLRRYNDITSWSHTKSLIDAFHEQMPVELKKRYPNGFFERQLLKGKCLILFDAFDELDSFENRATMARYIGSFLNTYNHQSNRFVVTTRIVGYEGQLDIYNFQIRTVQRLGEEETRALVNQRYKAIGLSETAGWQPHDAIPVLHDMKRRSERLIEKIKSTPRLAQLATNPLLLSLIVLVHYVKLELPQERVLLYRDCVEILTEQWQRSKQAELDRMTNVQEDFTFAQKLGLLQKLAFTMQMQRQEENRQTLLPRVHVQEIFAQNIRDILGSQLPTDESERKELCWRKAEAWINSIQVESGILVEQGLDEEGNPLIGFSHLTFQEYLAAIAINEAPRYLPLLRNNILQSTWREVVLLYVALTSDATSTVEYLLECSDQPAGILLAGFCIVEKVRHVKGEVQQLVLEKLEVEFERADSNRIASLRQILASIGGNEVIVFMRKQLQNAHVEKRLQAIKALEYIKINENQLKDIQKDLINVAEGKDDIAIIIEAKEVLAKIGDPRLPSKEPAIISIPQQTCSIAASPKGWKELKISPGWVNAKSIQRKSFLIARVFDYWLFTKRHPLRETLPQKQSFEIGKYLVTNIEYERFVRATKHPVPTNWSKGTYSVEKATHPVTGITPKDAEMYCKWLSQETGKIYRIPTEWEWEWAATGFQGWKYPWGDLFDANKCNIYESGIGETTPVGSYQLGINQFGVTDMSGNVWEITQGYISLLPLLLVAASLLLLGFAAAALLAQSELEAVFLGGAAFILILLGFLFGLKPFNSVIVDTPLRGGAFNTSYNEATCFSRREYSPLIKEVGFRCVRDSGDHFRMKVK
jgi:Sulfatase-modifying factor enzyme 1/NACHT domain